MDVSIIDEMPAGRIPIETRWILAAAVRYCFRMDGKELARGHQAYIICPLIEESEALDVKNATEIFEHMQSFYSPRYQVGLLHGKMKTKKKMTLCRSSKTISRNYWFLPPLLKLA